MSKQIIPIGSKVHTDIGVFEVINYNTDDGAYLCYQRGFDGHSGISHFGDNYINTKYEGQCWWFSEEEVSLIEESKVSNVRQPKFKAGDKVICVKKSMAIGVDVGKTYTVKKPDFYEDGFNIHVSLEEVESTPYEKDFELVNKQPKDYRKMKPTDLVDIVVDGKEFKVPLGDLVHTKALMGITNGLYGFDLWKAFDQLFKREGFIEDTDTVFEFVEKQRQVIQYFFKPHYDEQQKKDLEAQIVAKSNELLELQAKLKELT